jgi:hypothetical protein
VPVVNPCTRAHGCWDDTHNSERVQYNHRVGLHVKRRVTRPGSGPAEGGSDRGNRFGLGSKQEGTT